MRDEYAVEVNNVSISYRILNIYPCGVRFSITAMLETDIMLVDEVLSVGDERFKKKSLEKMKSP